MSDITNRLDDAAEDAIAEIKRLRSELLSLRIEVERLRLEIIGRDAERQRLCMTGKEREVLDEAKEFFLAIYRNHNGPKNAAIIQGLIDRLPGDAACA